jgi:hypothetical protein
MYSAVLDYRQLIHRDFNRPFEVDALWPDARHCCDFDTHLGIQCDDTDDHRQDVECQSRHCGSPRAPHPIIATGIRPDRLHGTPPHLTE